MEFLSSILTSQTSFPGEISACVANFLFQASHHCWGVSPRNDVWQVCGTSAEIFPDTNERVRSSLGGMVFVLARKLSCIEWAPFHLSFREPCLFHILPPMSTSLHWWDWKKPQESLQRTSEKNKQRHSWVSFGPTFQLHRPQYFWSPGAWHGVALCSGTNIKRKQREMRLTFQLGTVQPKGPPAPRTLLYNVVPSAFPSKNGWGGKRAFSRPTHFLREKPWGRGWLLYAYFDHFYAVYEIA